MVEGRLTEMALFYGATVALVGLWTLVAYVGVGRGYRTARAFDASTTTYRLYGWIAERWRAIATAGGFAAAAGITLATMASGDPVFVAGHLVGLTGLFVALFVLASIPISSAVEEAEQRVDAGEEPPVEARSPWGRALGPAVLWGVVIAVAWNRGSDGLWLGLFALGGLLNVAVVAWGSPGLSRWVSARIDRLLGREP